MQFLVANQMVNTSMIIWSQISELYCMKKRDHDHEVPTPYKLIPPTQGGDTPKRYQVFGLTTCIYFEHFGLKLGKLMFCLYRVV